MEKTDEQIARETIFGVPPQEQPTETPAGDPPATPPAEQPEGAPQTPDAPQETPAGETPPAQQQQEIDDQRFLELLNTRFNVKFDTIDAANEFVSGQQRARGQEQIIQQLTEKLKESSNVLSHFPSENAYKVAQLAKDKYPGKDAVLSNIIGADVDAINDFDAIKLAESLSRQNGSKVDPLRYKLSLLGLKGNDITEFDDWDDADKEIVYGAAEDARQMLKNVQNQVEVPATGDQSVLDLVSQIERGVQEQQQKTDELINQVSPIASTLVGNLTKIKPVDGEDFEYMITLDNESRQQLQDFIIAEAIEGGYNLQSDSDIRQLGSMLQSEIWATDGPKILAAYGKYMQDKTLQDARKKYENAEPLRQETPSAGGQKTQETDNDRARRLLGLG